MPLIDKIREEILIELAKARFDHDLKPAELKVLHDSAISEDLSESDENAPRPEIRAAFLRWLATDLEAAQHIDPKGLRVHAATIPGDLDLERCHVNPTLMFFRCNFHGEIYLQVAETRGLFVFDSLFAEGIHADGVIVRGQLFLECIHSKEKIRLVGARIEGSLVCNGAKLMAEGRTLSADGAKIGGDVFLEDGFESEGEISLLGAEIAVDLACIGAKLRAKGEALKADGAKIGGEVLLMDGFESEGMIRMPNAEIGGNLLIRDAKVKVVVCQDTVVKGDLV